MIRYGLPARKLTVIGVTGTKGKSSVAEMLYTILMAAGHKTALAGTIRFAIGTESEPNRFKMTLPGRGYIQKFLARAVRSGATYAVIEVTSEAARQYRHLGLFMDALIFTNLQKEHIESHGSFENYFQAKFKIGKALAHSPKRPRTIIANADDERGPAFLTLPVEQRVAFGTSDIHITHSDHASISFTYKNVPFTIPHPGTFSALNALAATKAAESFGVPLAVCAEALGTLQTIPGRLERVDVGQNFLAIVDYAHTPDSLRALYDAFPNRKKICVLGNTGGGRDTWKRPEMAKIAEAQCAHVILTNEDPYDEDPKKILDDMASGMSIQPEIELDRRLAIRSALALAEKDDVVLISGKGTDPYIMGPKGTKTPWSDAAVVKEELTALAHTKERGGV
jgi:UDP-N-acetylmuramoyl-L-alanyl-D-glutamate--2,6-diaminopimelate ligase